MMKLVYYTVVALGMTDEYDVMEEYLRSYGIRLPDEPDGEDKINVAVVYAALKYDAVYALYGKEVSIPVGVDLDSASVIIFAALSGIMLPSGVTSFPGLAVYTVKNYVKEFEDLPVSKNPDSAEVFYWAKIIAASSADTNDDDMGDYVLPQMAYDKVDPADKEYVDYAYYATILNTAYDVTLDVEALQAAVENGNSTAVQKLILETMLSEKNVRVNSNMNTKELFDLACENGCFNLEEEFYSDVFNYDITIAQDRTKMWITPFSVADQLDGGNSAATTMSLNGIAAGHNKTTGIALDPAKANETITLTIYYNDGVREDQATYTFNIIKDKSLNGTTTSSDNSMVQSLQSMAGAVNPSGNEKVDEIIDGVVDYAQNELPEFSTSPQGDILTTFGNTYNEATSGSSSGYDGGYEFGYLQELLDGKYATDADGNIITTKGASFVGIEDETENSIIEKATTVVKENPEIVAAPTSVIALGALAGYLMMKKHRDSEMLVLPEESEEEEE